MDQLVAKVLHVCLATIPMLRADRPVIAGAKWRNTVPVVRALLWFLERVVNVELEGVVVGVLVRVACEGGDLARFAQRKVVDDFETHCRLVEY